MPALTRAASATACLLIGLLGAGCDLLHSQPKTFPLAIEISHVVGGAPLQLDSAAQQASYKTAAGDDYSVSRLRYYLSGFRLRRADGSSVQAPADVQSSAGYFLVDAAKPESQAFEFIQAPAGDYSGIEFLLGVDAARNHAGAQTGTLDPARGMFWTWHTGYIFLSLEGRSPQSGADAGALTFHLGGGEGAAALARSVYLPVPQGLRVRANLEPLVHLHADIGALFHAVHEIRFVTTHTVMDAGGGVELADNAAAMFSIDHVHHEPPAALAQTAGQHSP